jgi:hypothetical protein
MRGTSLARGARVVGISAGTWVGVNSTGDAGVLSVVVARSTRIEDTNMHWLYQSHSSLRAAGLVPMGGRKPGRFRVLEPP